MKTILSLIIIFIILILVPGNSLGQNNEAALQYFQANSSVLNDKSGKLILGESSSPDTIVLNSQTAGVTNFGQSVSSAGDVNGDGFSDVIVGAPTHDGDLGIAYIFYGGPLMDNIADVIFSASPPSQHFGASVSSVGDLNLDGFSDIIIGAWLFGNYRGRAYIYYGGVNMNNVPDVILTGESQHSYFGISVSSAGDVNGDGYLDVVVGAHNYTDINNIYNVGRSYIYFGGATMDTVPDVVMTGEANHNYFGNSVSTCGDVNGDNFDDVIVGAPGYNSEYGKAYIFFGSPLMNNSPDLTILNETGQRIQFGFSVSTAGDVNGDGFSDVIVGGFTYDVYRGIVFVYYGSQNMDNTADVQMTGETIESHFGRSISLAGDINSDGFSDIVIGAYDYNSSGRAYIYFGGYQMNNIADINLSSGTFNEYFGYSVKSAGDLNGDSFADIIVGAPVGVGRAYIYTNIVSKPILVSPENNSSNNPLTINFKWKKLNSAIHYILKVSSDSILSNLIFNDTIQGDTTKSISGFTKGVKYYWRVTALDTNGIDYTSARWTFETSPPLKLSLKILIEGMYYPIFNQMTRKDSVKVFLCSTLFPFGRVDSAIAAVDSLSFSALYQFHNAQPGTYYIVANHFNCISVWSKTGGETLTANGLAHSYDFTTSASQAFGNNLKRKGTKYCMFSGDTFRDGFIDGSDFLIVDNDAYAFTVGRFIPSDLNGDNFVDAVDMQIGDNNRSQSEITP